MIIALFYISLISMYFLYTYLFSIEFIWTSPLLYIILIGIFILSFISSIVIILLITEVMGKLRRRKEVRNRFNHTFSKQLLSLVNHLMRVKIVVTGYDNVPKDNKFVLIGNHQDNFDIMVYLPVFKDHPINFIAKKSLFTTPITGQWISCLGNIPISRFADREAAEAIIEGIKRYKEGSPMAIFPEGKRSFSNEMIEFKAGAFKLAMKPKADILIGVLYDVYKVSKLPFYKKKTVYVHFLPILKYEEYKDMKSQELSDFVKGKIQNQLDNFKKALN